jgi:hypothetical protein
MLSFIAIGQRENVRSDLQQPIATNEWVFWCVKGACVQECLLHLSLHHLGSLAGICSQEGEHHSALPILPEGMAIKERD